MHSSFSQIKKYISLKNINTVFIDFFDTIVYRNTHPEYIKYLHSKRLTHIFGLNHFTTEEFYNIRRTYEDNLVRELENRGYKTEFNYDDLSKELYKLIREYKGDIHLSEEDFISYSAKIEIELEKVALFLYNDSLDFLRWCSKKNLNVIVVSDFYMPSKYFNIILKSLGIDNLIQKIYISCEEKTSKRKGDLYPKILMEEGLANSDVIMIGDSFISDFIHPGEYDIKSFYLDRANKHKFYYNDIVRKQNEKKSKLYVEKELDKLFKGNIEFEKIVLSLFEFTEKLYINLTSKKAKSVFFLSREGQYLKKLFDIYQEKMSLGKNDIKSNYFYVSRRSTLVASLDKLEDETFDTIFRQYKDISILDFIKTIGFSSTEIELITNDIKEKINPEERVHEFAESKNFEILKNNSNFIKIYEKKRGEQRKIFTDYLATFNENLKDKMFVVDAGWKGTIQDHIFRSLDKKSTVWGFYIGLLRPVWMDAGNFKKGLVFKEYPSNSKYLAPYKENHTIFEVLLLADHGSVRGYERKNSTVVPVLEDNSDEMNLFENYIKNLQNKYFVLFENLCDFFNQTHLSTKDLEDYFAKKHAELMFRPTLKELKLYNKFYNYDNFGIFEKFEYRKYSGIRTKVKTIFLLLKSPKTFLKEQVWPVQGLYNLRIPFLWRAYGYVRMWMM